MPKIVNEIRFELQDPEARSFFKSRGFVVLRGVFGESDRADVERAWDEVVAEGAQTTGMSPVEFASRYPQNRDLWQKHPSFRRLLLRRDRGNWQANSSAPREPASSTTTPLQSQLMRRA